MKRLLQSLLSLCMVALFCACSSDDSVQVAPTQPVGPDLSKVEGIVSLAKENIGTWDEGYVSSQGYVLTRGLDERCAPAAAKTRADEDVDEDQPSCVSFMTGDHKTIVHLFLDTEGLPSQLVLGDYSLNFSFLNDTIMEVVLATPTDYTYQTTVPYNRPQLLEAIASRNYEFVFQTKLAVLVELLQGADIPEQFASVVDYFRALCKMTLAADPEATLADLTTQGLFDADGDAAFVATINESYTVIIVKVNYGIVLWTGKASFKVGGTSCTLSGTVKCASNRFNDYGTYGIVCDTDPSRLTVDQAEYVGTAVQTGSGFDVDFRGLKPLTKYYYRAFYRFNSSDHGSFNFKYGDADAEVGYDTQMKEFTTGENRLTVDVVMCIDCTGSMSSLIHTVQRAALSFYDAFMAKCDDAGIELSGLNNKVFGFRDINVDDNAFEESPTYAMPDEREQFASFVNGLYADGGGDAPESGLEVLDKAFTYLETAQDDGYHRQVVILWTDVSFLSHPSYTALTVDGLRSHWNKLSSGRRLILFAPNSTYGNDTSWSVFDDWKNVIHSTSISDSFTDFDYVLSSIVEELTSRGAAPKKAPKKAFQIVGCPNN